MVSDINRPKSHSKKQKTNHALDDESSQIKDWLQSTYRAQKGSSLARNEVYELYLAHCTSKGLTPISSPNFGKLIRSAFPFIKTRRLGTRGQSRYHYSGIAEKNPDVHVASLAVRLESDLESSAANIASSVLDTPYSSDNLASWNDPAPSLDAMDDDHSSIVPAKLPLLTAPFSQCYEDPLILSALRHFVGLYQEHCRQLLLLVTTGSIDKIEEQIMIFRNTIPDTIQSLLHNDNDLNLVEAVWKWDSALYDTIISSFLPTIYASLSQTTTRELLDYIQEVHRYPHLLWKEHSKTLCRMTSDVARIFAAKFRRLLSLNNTAQAALNVLQCPQSIAKLEFDLTNANILKILQHACFLDKEAVTQATDIVQNDVLPLLNTKADINQWITWLDTLVTTHVCSDVSQATRFVRAWTLYSSVVLRDIALQNTSSSEHLHAMQLFIDDYVIYLVEERVAIINMMHRRTPSSTQTEASPAALTRLPTLELSQTP